MKKYLLILILIAGITAILRWQSFTILLDRDEGAYAYIASHLNEANFLPYRDAFDHKPPGIYFIYAIFMQFIGKNVLAIRVAGYINAVISTLIFILILRKMKIGHFNYIFFTLLYMFVINSMIFDGLSDNTEVYMTTFLTLGLYFFNCFVEKPKRYIFILFAGITTALAFHIKHVAIFNILALFGWSFFYNKVNTKRVIAYFLTGFFTVTILFFIYFWSMGSLFDYWEAVYLFNYKYLSEGINEVGRIRGLIDFVLFYPNHVLLIMVAFMTLIVTNRENIFDRKILLYVLWSAASLFAAKILVRNFWHYYYPFVQSFIILLAVTSNDLRSKSISRIVALYVFVLTIYLITLRPYDMISQTRGEGNVELKYKMQTLSETIKHNTGDNEKVMVTFMESPQALFYSGRMSSTRFLYSTAKDIPTFSDELRNEVPSTKLIIGRKDWLDKYIGLDFEKLGFKLIEQEGEVIYLKK